MAFISQSVQHEITESVNTCTPAGENQSRCVGLLDDGGAIEHGAGFEAGAVMDGSFDCTLMLAEENARAAWARRAPRRHPLFFRLRRSGGAVDRAQSNETQRCPAGKAERALVRRVKCGRKRGERITGTRLERNLEMIALADIADIGEIAPAHIICRNIFLCHERAALRIDPLARGLNLSKIDYIDVARESGRDLMLDGCGQEAGGGQHARMARHQNARNPELLRQRASMQRAASAKRQKRELAGIVTLADGDKPDAFRHLAVHDAVNAERGLLHVELERPRDHPLDRFAGKLRLELETAAREMLGAQIAKHAGRVRHGGVVTTETVTSGPRLR